MSKHNSKVIPINSFVAKLRDNQKKVEEFLNNLGSQSGLFLADMDTGELIPITEEELQENYPEYLTQGILDIDQYGDPMNIEVIKDIVGDVEIFNDIFAVPLGFDKESIKLRLRLMEEEYKETKNAMLEALGELELGNEVSVSTKVKILDGLVDQTVINIGTADVFKWDFRGAWHEVAASNMSKINDDGTVDRRKDGKVLKGQNYRKPELKDCVITDVKELWEL